MYSSYSLVLNEILKFGLSSIFSCAKYESAAPVTIDHDLMKMTNFTIVLPLHVAIAESIGD